MLRHASPESGPKTGQGMGKHPICESMATNKCLCLQGQVYLCGCRGISHMAPLLHLSVLGSKLHTVLDCTKCILQLKQTVSESQRCQTLALSLFRSTTGT